MTKDGQSTPAYFEVETCDLNTFKSVCGRSLADIDVPLADMIQKNVPIYDIGRLGASFSDPIAKKALMAEWASVLLSGSGVLVLQNAYQDTAIIDQATRLYDQIIADEKAGPGGGADHFAASGANDRVWNSLQKLCEVDADVFAQYFCNPAIAVVCEAWLGPNYQMTAQVNLVHPGGKAQQAHRDYHLGFQTAGQSVQYPAHVHELSPVMTLQGGIAHCDMSIESGPTKFLPFSQTYKPGYAAWRRDDFRAYFDDNHIQLPLSKGDAVFFSPALFHAAGENRSTDVHRMVNLLQVSSAFGRAMESIERRGMCKLVYPVLQRALSDETMNQAEVEAVIASTAEGYSFPTNLDRDPPSGGLAPETQAALMQRALGLGMSAKEFGAALDAIADRQGA